MLVDLKSGRAIAIICISIGITVRAIIIDFLGSNNKESFLNIPFDRACFPLVIRHAVKIEGALGCTFLYPLANLKCSFISHKK